MARILVIDDDSDFLEMLSLLLEKGGHQVTMSADGEDGLSKALADPPDLLLLDLMMPGVTGFDICRRLRAESATASMPIIVLSARGQPVDREAALEAGADDYMSKPVTMTDLSERIGALLIEQSSGKAPAFSGTVTLLSLRGGVGVTTLAVNLSSLLVQSGGSGVCLVDLCPSSGHAALQLGLRPEPSWSDLARVGEFGAVAIDTYLLKHDSGLRVLASPVIPVVGQQRMQLPVARTAFSTLQRGFSVVTVDAPPVLDDATMAAVEAATVVGLVVTAESPSIQSAVGTLRIFKDWFAKFRIILNQVTPGPMPAADAIERALKRPVIGSIPFDPAQAEALARGTPLALAKPSSPLAQGVGNLAGALTQGLGGGQ